MVIKTNCINLINNIERYLNTGENVSKEIVSEVIDSGKVEYFLNEVEKVKDILNDDIEFFQECDPACNSKEEIIAAYPGYKAILTYRVANILFKMGYRVEARIISESAHTLTGIDIHPGATIDHPFFIDHGTGIVIGESVSSDARGIAITEIVVQCVDGAGSIA